MKKKIKKPCSNLLIFGGTGLLGNCFIENYKNIKKIHLAINKTKPNDKNLKFVDTNKVAFLKRYLVKEKIDTILNFAGLTNIEKCQKNKKKSYISNYILPIKLAQISKEIGINYIFISTDNFSFKSKKLSENSKVIPLNNYSKNKIKSEKKIIQIYPKSLIIRTNFYCVGNLQNKSFSDIILKTIKLGKKINLFKDVYYTPIYAKLLFAYIFKLLEEKKSGLFNISSNEIITKYEFGLKICKIFNLNKELICPDYLKKRKDLVRRPFNMSLNNTKLKKILKIKVPTINNQLKLMKNEYKIK